MLRGKFPRSRYFWAGVATVIVIASLTVFVVSRRNATPTPTAAAFSEFLTAVDGNRVASVTVAGDGLLFELRDGRRYETVPPPGYVAANASFATELAKRGVRLDVKRAETSSANSYGAMLFGLLFLGAAGFALFRLASGRVPTLERARTIDPEEVTVTFADVAGVDEAKEEVSEIVDFLKDPGRFSSLGGRIPRGVLLVGPPGTGKTLLARSMAGEAGVPFISASGSDFVEMYAGVR